MFSVRRSSRFITSFAQPSGGVQPAAGGGADVAFDTAPSPVWDSDDGTTAVTAITVGSGSNRILIACVQWIDNLAGNASVSGVSSDLDGTLSLLGASTLTRSDGADWGIAWYYRLAPSVGTHNVTATMSEATDAILCAPLSYANVSQSSPTAGVSTADQSNTGTTYTHNFSTAAGDMAISGCINSGVTAPNFNVTTGNQRFEVFESGFWGAGSSVGDNLATGASTDVAWLIRNDITLFSGFVLKKA